MLGLPLLFYILHFIRICSIGNHDTSRFPLLIANSERILAISLGRKPMDTHLYLCMGALSCRHHVIKRDIKSRNLYIEVHTLACVFLTYYCNIDVMNICKVGFIMLAPLVYVNHQIVTDLE